MRDTERRNGPIGERRARRATSQVGSSLVEVLVAVFLVGTVVLALAIGMLTLMQSTRSVSEQQRLDAAVLSYSEFLRTQDYVPCASPDSYATWAGPPGVEGKISTVLHWQREPDDAMDAAAFVNACSPDMGRQLLELAVQLDGGPDVSAQVVLRSDP